jgi:thiosulfate dehydrogenase [quinone] large subunit
MQKTVARVGLGQRSFFIILFVLRLALGGLMFEAGLDKILSGSFTAAGFLKNATGPFAGFYTNIAGNSAMLSVTNVLVPWGELLVGVAIILGLVVRFASFWGIVLMILYYTAALPPANGWVAQQIIYLVVFIAFIVSGIGYFLGLDAFASVLEERRNPLRIFLG